MSTWRTSFTSSCPERTTSYGERWCSIFSRGSIWSASSTAWSNRRRRWSPSTNNPIAAARRLRILTTFPGKDPTNWYRNGYGARSKTICSALMWRTLKPLSLSGGFWRINFLILSPILWIMVRWIKDGDFGANNVKRWWTAWTWAKSKGWNYDPLLPLNLFRERQKAEHSSPAHRSLPRKTWFF